MLVRTTSRQEQEALRDADQMFELGVLGPATIARTMCRSRLH